MQTTSLHLSEMSLLSPSNGQKEFLHCIRHMRWIQVSWLLLWHLNKYLQTNYRMDLSSIDARMITISILTRDLHRNGIFQLHDWLVMVRSWWIDEYITCNCEKRMEIILNDDCFEDMNRKYINTYDGSINSLMACTIYDHYFILVECKEAHGVISDYKHDLKNEKLHVFIDLENSSPLTFFQESDVDSNKTSVLDLNYCKEDRERYNDNNDPIRRRLATTTKLKKTISLTIKEMHKSDVDIYYEGKKMCKIMYFDIMVGFKNKCGLDFNEQKLFDILGS